MDSKTHHSEWSNTRQHSREGTVQDDTRSSLQTGGANRESRRYGAEAGLQQSEIEQAQLSLLNMILNPCPEHVRSLVEETSLEELIYWKLQTLFEKFEEEQPTDMLKTVYEHVERPLFSLVLKKTKGNQSRAAEVLGCNRNTLHRKLKGLAIKPKEVRRAMKIAKNRRLRAEIENMLTP